MTRRTTRLMAVIAIIFSFSIVPAAIPGTVAQDATQEPQGDGESELAPQLPAVDLPTMSSMGYVFEIDAVWEGTANTPEDLPVYAFTPTVYSEEMVAQIADSLGIDGEIESQGEGTYSVSGNGSIYTTPGLLQFVSSVEAPDEDMPGDNEAIAFAREWLRISDLLPANSNDGAVIETIETPARKIVEFKPATPSNLLSAIPSITVTIGPGGTVLEARVSWASISEDDIYRLRSVEEAFNQVTSRLSYLDITLPEDQFPQGSTITGTATYESVSIAYSVSGAPGGAQYLQPVYVFDGTYTPEDSDNSYPVIAYVPAIVTSLQPVG